MKVIFRLTLIFSSVIFNTLFAQSPTQNVRGKVFDSESRFQLSGAKIQIITNDSTLILRALSDLDGYFILKTHLKLKLFKLKELKSFYFFI